jgi:hypothetical protein
MFKKILFVLLIVEILICWPLSLIKKTPNISFKTIFFPITQEEQVSINTKLGLDTSLVKKFYYNRTTVFKDRYINNVLILIDPNNYFFMMHPREGIPDIVNRFKYPFWAIIFLIPGIYITIRNKKYFKIWFLFFTEILILSFFKKIDGLDLILFLPISWLLYLGIKNFSKYKYFWILNLLLIFLMTIEIGRMFL